MSEINEPTLFGFTCSTCGHEGYVHSSADANSNITSVACPECGADILAFSQALTQEDRIALMEEIERHLDDKILEDAMARLGINGVSVEQARGLISLLGNRGATQ
jgi:DNA-directed RNA polymerase subunit RPC12/RpoP